MDFSTPQVALIVAGLSLIWNVWQGATKARKDEVVVLKAQIANLESRIEACEKTKVTLLERLAERMEKGS